MIHGSKSSVTGFLTLNTNMTAQELIMSIMMSVTTLGCMKVKAGWIFTYLSKSADNDYKQKTKVN